MNSTLEKNGETYTLGCKYPVTRCPGGHELYFRNPLASFFCSLGNMQVHMQAEYSEKAAVWEKPRCVFSLQTPSCQRTCAPRMEHWSPRRQQEQGLEWRLCMSSKPGPSGPPAPPWRRVYAAWSPPTSASLCAASRCSGTTSCYTTALLPWGSEEPEALTVITPVGRWRGSWVKSWGGVQWSPPSLTPCFWSGRGGNDVGGSAISLSWYQV